MRIHHTPPRRKHRADCSEDLLFVGVCIVLIFVATGVVAWALAKLGGMA